MRRLRINERTEFKAYAYNNRELLASLHDDGCSTVGQIISRVCDKAGGWCKPITDVKIVVSEQEVSAWYHRSGTQWKRTD